MTHRSETSRWIAAPRERVFAAFMDPDQLVRWQAPERMSARIESFDGRVGGSYTMVLRYELDDPVNAGKTTAHEDRYTAIFTAIEPPARIVETVTFDTTDPHFMGEMTITAAFAEERGGTIVTMTFEHIPPGINPADNELGTAQSLQKLAQLLE